MKRNILIASVASVLTIGGASAGAVLLSSPGSAGADDSPIVQTLSNHEARIKNTENNVKDLQAVTGTPESAENTPASPVGAPVASTSPVASAQPASTPEASNPATETITFDMSHGSQFTSN